MGAAMPSPVDCFFCSLLYDVVIAGLDCPVVGDLEPCFSVGFSSGMEKLADWSGCSIPSSSLESLSSRLVVPATWLVSIFSFS